MTLNKTGFIASGYAHPEIKPGDIYRDNKGRLVMVDKCEYGRVYFIRDGFSFTTELLARVFLDRFRLHRRRKAPAMSTNATTKVQALRTMINASREAGK
ncbi:DUF4222 domain-containing protein [Salmonella enterica]|uniref:DUF4222 domain-containing protein n=1 Tax=Salmonella enterica subsp. diarizonae serovar 48:i:z TaxID=1192842 RepID=A0A7U5YD18_SALDZ|nr:DUF4222 domain-containing protein [Salmonella enterica]EAA4450259.1 DUF4222 domain-containing protein [Salmonella enterica subsp. diarizonae]EDW6116427.1 DUF4222 domain-containing protein [Salmonella enterica subsp. salamae]AXC70700.1 DUF4222 domain-containing protein [Salmonella enterica subsp. diarizonae serovar 48:i:z]EAM2672787.1 DUF4222 domain-containing protein [Salmonella enterica]EAM6405351.1 DUF4222 domain-containing protein [Salmonella enterica]